LTTKIGFLLSIMAFLSLVGSLSSATANDFKRCGVYRHVPVLQVVDSAVGIDFSGQVYIDVWVKMNPDSSFIRGMKVRPGAVTQFSGTVQLALPEGHAHGVGISISNQAITTTVPTKLRLTVKHGINREKLLAIPAKELEAWVCHRAFTYDDGTSIIMN
jgi:hypothetical protein